MRPYYQAAGVALYNADALALVRSLETASIDLILTDPPYFRVKGEQWDRQWDSRSRFLDWIAALSAEWARVLKPNGSLYVFASPKMAAHVEVTIGKHLNVLNRVRWVKAQGWHRKAQKESLRSYLSPWEEIIFAEHFGSDGVALGESGYSGACDKARGFVFEPLRAYLRGEFDRAGVHISRANAYCGTASMAARHYFTRSQWCLPTAGHHASLQFGLNREGQRGHEDLRQDYEDLRRPFSVTPEVPYTDMWAFDTVPARPGKHPCEKPTAMLEHIIAVSSRPGATVLDSFFGSGATAEATVRLGRRFIGSEQSLDWCKRASDRVRFAARRLDVEQAA